MTRVAAVQMRGRVADIAYNLDHIRELLDEAVRYQPDVIALPEFFTTPIVEDQRLWQCALPANNPALDLLREYAIDHKALIGGSYLEKRGDAVFNCYTLVRPNGEVSRHDKDFPTMIENAYYQGGSDDGRHDTDLGRVGTAVCWETIRTQTVKRLSGKIDFLMTGTHWWSTPDNWVIGRGFMRQMDQLNRHYIHEAPSTLSRLLGCANIHAAHCGKLSGRIPVLPKGLLSAPFNSYLTGETQLIDNQGNCIARLSAEDGTGVLHADLDLTPTTPSLDCPERFWIPPLAARFRFFWWQQNLCGKSLYRQAQRQGKIQEANNSRLASALGRSAMR